MRKITRLLLLLALGIIVGWSNSVYAAEKLGSESNLSEGEAGAGLQAVIEGCYELVDGELVTVEELEGDKIYFISATLKNVADQAIEYWNPDQKYNDELYNIWFKFKLPATIGHDIPGQVVLKANASRRNYDDRWNTSEVTLEVYAHSNQALALEFVPGYCGIDTLRQINSYHYFMRSEEDCTLVYSDHDSENPIAPGEERSILLAVRTRDAQALAEKRELDKVSRLRTSFTSLRMTDNPIVDAMPIVSDVLRMSQIPVLELPHFDATVDNYLVAEVEIPKWLEQQSNDQWWIHANGKVYAEDGNICFWAGLYNHEVIYDLDSTATQNVFNLQALLVHLDSIEAWYLGESGEKVTLEVSEVMLLPDLSTEPSPSLILENNCLSAKIALDGDLATELAGKTIYISYGYSQVDVTP